jgi:hypothetical protein
VAAVDHGPARVAHNLRERAGKDARLTPAEVEQAAADVDRLIAEIDGAS